MVCRLEESRKLVAEGCTALQEDRRDTPPKRQYPPIYEKLVPMALITIAVVIVLLLVVVLVILLNLIPSTP